MSAQRMNHRTIENCTFPLTGFEEKTKFFLLFLNAYIIGDNGKLVRRPYGEKKHCAAKILNPSNEIFNTDNCAVLLQSV